MSFKWYNKSDELISKAKEMRKEGYPYASIAKYLGFNSEDAVYYHTNKKFKENRLLITRRWRDKNRAHVLMKMREYNKRHHAEKKRIKVEEPAAV